MPAASRAARHPIAGERDASRLRRPQQSAILQSGGGGIREQDRGTTALTVSTRGCRTRGGPSGAVSSEHTVDAGCLRCRDWRAERVSAAPHYPSILPVHLRLRFSSRPRARRCAHSMTRDCTICGSDSISRVARAIRRPRTRSLGAVSSPTSWRTAFTATTGHRTRRPI